MRRAAEAVGNLWIDELREQTSKPRWTYRQLRRHPLFARARPSGVDPALVGAHAESGRALSRGWFRIVSVSMPLAIINLWNRTRWARYFTGDPTKRMVGRPVTKRAWRDIERDRRAVIEKIGIPIKKK